MIDFKVGDGGFIPPFFFTNMIHLLTNTASQTIRLTLDEGRQMYSDAFTHYLLILTLEDNGALTGETLAQVPIIVIDNERFTQLTITTETLLTAGTYRYDVYGQNSSSNTDVEDASVVGIIEKGTAILTDSTVYFTTANQTIENDIVAG